MSFHLRITLQRQSPWVQILCTNSAGEVAAPKASMISEALSTSETPLKSESLHPDDFLPTDAEAEDAKLRAEEMREHRRWLATLKLASRELRLSEEAEIRQGYPVSASCKAESAEALEAAIEEYEDYLAQVEE